MRVRFQACGAWLFLLVAAGWRPVRAGDVTSPGEADKPVQPTVASPTPPAVAPLPEPPHPPPAAAALPPQSPSPPAVPDLAKISPLGEKPVWTRLERFQRVLTRQQFEEAWKTTYSAEGAAAAPFKIENGAVVIPTGDPAQPDLRIELKPAATDTAPPAQRYWRTAADLPPLNGRPPLSDIHFALDPGHIGGTWARMEERYLSFHPGEAIQEGDLALTAAKVLADRLRDLGAVVSLVRSNSEPVTERRPADFVVAARQVLREAGIINPAQTYAGLTGDARIITVQWQAEKFFYRISEIRARADKVNREIKPDVVLCLHFNAEDWGAAETPQFSPKNHLHVMINGCYAPEEWAQQDVRYEMFQRLFGRLQDEELPLATAVAEAVAQSTGLPPYVYTTPNARRAGGSPYVYARNLLANRLYECPVVYLEPYVMNHEQTYRRLLLGHYVGRSLVAGHLETSAIEDYVQGVVRGLLAYYQSHRRPS